MTNRSKHLPYYLFLCGCLSMSIGFNLIQYEKIKNLEQQKTMYKIFFEYFYLKSKSVVYNKTYGGEMYRLDDRDYISK